METESPRPILRPSSASALLLAEAKDAMPSSIEVRSLLTAQCSGLKS